MGIESLEDLERLANENEEEELEETEEASVKQEDDEEEVEQQKEPEVKKEGPNKSEQQAETPPDVQAFVPDFKITVKDKNYEIPEWAKGSIKDANTEKEIKEFFNKYYGFDEVQKSRDNWKSKYEESYNNLQKNDIKYKENEQTIDYIASCLDDIDKGDVLVGLSKLCANNEQLFTKLVNGVDKYLSSDDLTRMRMDNDYSRKLDNYYRGREQNQYKQQEQDIQYKYNQMVYKNAEMNIDNILEYNNNYRHFRNELRNRFGNDLELKKYIANVGQMLYPDIEKANFNHVVEVAYKEGLKYFNVNEHTSEVILNQGQPTSQPANNQSMFNSGQTSPKKTVIVRKDPVTQVPSMQNSNLGNTVAKKRISSIAELTEAAGIEED